MAAKAIQEYYPDHLNQCHGCGVFNPQGLGIRSYWHGDRAVCTFTPEPFHLGPPGFVYGGLIASLIDCHANATASGAAHAASGKELGDGMLPRFVTASLHVDYLRPTPLAGPIELVGTIKKTTARKTVVEVTLSVAGTLCARGEVVSVLAPARFTNPPGTPATAS